MAGSVISRLAYLTLAAVLAQSEFTFKIRSPPALKRWEGSGVSAMSRDQNQNSVGNAYRVTDKVNISDLQTKLQRRIDMITDTAKKLSEMTPRS
jgi:hypothetical protein